MRLALAWLHLLALAIGMGAVWARAHALREVARTPAGDTAHSAALKAAFLADTYWGIAAGLWLLTGLGRAFGPFEKGSAYYLSNSFFLAKMGLFLLILALELWPMITLIRWRIALKRGAAIDTSRARAIAGISHLQALLLAIMVLLAAAMARGSGSMRAG